MTLFNADDYGVTPDQCRHILDCRAEGCLTGVSVMPNAPFLPKAMAMLGDDPALRVAVHLNVTEGKCLSKPEDVPLLAGPDGRFRLSFFKLFALSLGPKRDALKAQLTRELTAQIEGVRPFLEDRPLRLDGHQHIQMVPVVMETVRDIVKAWNYPVEYIRFSREPLGPYLKKPGLWRFYGPVNILKNLVLNVFAWRDGAYMRDMDLDRGMVMGLVLSGNMEYRLVSRLLPAFEKAAARRGCDLELVTHPGWGIGPGQGLDVPGGPFEAFGLSPGRKKEYDCLRQL